MFGLLSNLRLLFVLIGIMNQCNLVLYLRVRYLEEKKNPHTQKAATAYWEFLFQIEILFAKMTASRMSSSMNFLVLLLHEMASKLAMREFRREYGRSH